MKLASVEDYEITEIREDEEPIKKVDEDALFDVSRQTRKHWISDYALGRVMANQNYILLTTGTTGCQPAGSKVLMADGTWKNVENVKVGDLVLSPQEDGSHIYAPVLKTYEWYSEKNYHVIDRRNNNILYTCSSNHKMPLYYRRANKPSAETWTTRIFKAEQLTEWSTATLRTRPVITSVEIKKFKDRENCSIEPYSLGVFLGDGCSCLADRTRYYVTVNKTIKQCAVKQRSLSITSADDEIMEEVMKHYSVSNIRKSTSSSKTKDYRFSLRGNLMLELRRCGLEGKNSAQKFIPTEALLSDSKYRKKLLAGLIDTDGHYDGYGYAIVTKSSRLADDICSLVHSLGSKATKREQPRRVLIKGKKIKRMYYCVSINLGRMKIPIKTERKKQKKKKYKYRTPNRRTLKIDPADSSMVYGFTLDSPSSLYITNNWSTTCNSGKSYNSMAIGLDIDSEFDIDRVVFTPEDFIKIVKSGLPPGSVIIWDEAGVGLSSREWYSLQNKMIAYVLETFRRDNLILIMTTPNMSYIDKKVRSLFHGYAETIDPTFTGGAFGWVKYFHIIVDIRRGATLFMYPRIRDKSGRTKVVRGKTVLSGNMQFSKPPEWLLEPYEAKKLEFTESLKDSALRQMMDQKNVKFRLEIGDIIEIIEDSPQRYGLADDDLTKTDKIDKAWVMLSLEHPSSKINKTVVSSAINYLIQIGDYQTKGRRKALKDSDVEVVQRLLKIHKKKTVVAKSLGISIQTLHKDITDWKNRGLWEDDKKSDDE